MRWLDVAGPPGVGKSTLCDPLWGPRDIKWNGESPPAKWSDFLACVRRLMRLIQDHESYGKCASMVERSINKMAAVRRMAGDGCYVQTAFAQRGLGIGWRLKDQEAIADYFELMPVSVGVVFLVASVETIKRRNVERQKDRSHMVEGMVRPREIGFAILKSRGVDVIEMDTETTAPEVNIARLKELAGLAPCPA